MKPRQNEKPANNQRPISDKPVSKKQNEQIKITDEQNHLCLPRLEGVKECLRDITPLHHHRFAWKCALCTDAKFVSNAGSVYNTRGGFGMPVVVGPML
eukprot:3777427-Amphidinium_carterae.1